MCPGSSNEAAPRGTKREPARPTRAVPVSGSPIDPGSLDRSALQALLDRPRIRRVFAVLDRDGEETRIVGGAVRNALLGRPVTEVDFATTAPPAVTTRRAEAAGAIRGARHRWAAVMTRGLPRRAGRCSLI